MKRKLPILWMVSIRCVWRSQYWLKPSSSDLERNPNGWVSGRTARLEHVFLFFHLGKAFLAGIWGDAVTQGNATYSVNELCSERGCQIE
jgi:hypothetical protein